MIDLGSLWNINPDLLLPIYYFYKTYDEHDKNQLIYFLFSIISIITIGFKNF